MEILTVGAEILLIRGVVFEIDYGFVLDWRSLGVANCATGAVGSRDPVGGFDAVCRCLMTMTMSLETLEGAAALAAADWKAEAILAGRQVVHQEKQSR